VSASSFGVVRSVSLDTRRSIPSDAMYPRRIASGGPEASSESSVAEVVDPTVVKPREVAPSVRDRQMAQRAVDHPQDA
jgi:hypothetical protein